MPLRNFTLRLYTRLLFKLKPNLANIDQASGGNDLTRYQWDTIMEAVKKCCNILKKYVMINAPEQQVKVRVYDPEYRLYENFREQVLNFVPPEESLLAEYTRNLANPLMLLRLQSDKLNNKIP